MLAAWNRDNPEKRVGIDDRMVEFGGKSMNGTELVETLKKEQKIPLTVLKCHLGAREAHDVCLRQVLKHNAAQEAVSAACDVKVQPPLCRVPLSAKNEREAWKYIKKQTLERVAQHTSSITEDDRLLSEDDSKSSLTINQRHALIVRREEKMVLRSWCSVVVRMVSFLDARPDADILATIKISADQVLENEEPRQRPNYWEKLLQQPETVEAECAKLS
eukprot:symbB.v1.2.002550.t1/scaffold136.1/size304296/3